MLEGIESVQARIQEIQARISSLYPTPPAPPKPPASGINSTLLPDSPTGRRTVNFLAPRSAPRPFDLTLAQMRGQVQLRKMESAPADFKPNIEALIQKYANQNGLKPELVRAVIQQESSGNPRSVSVVGAVGLMQLMPATARGLGVSDPFDPEQNVAGGTKYLAGLLREFDGDLPKSLAAYNAGPAAVRKHGGIPPFAETQNYVRRIMGMLEQR